MFSYLKGILVSEGEGESTIEVGGVGYRLVTARSLGSIGELVVSHIFEVIREDRFDLYGFNSPDDRVLFETFLGVQGVGPKSALKIVATAAADDLRRKILNNDVAFFSSISGIGKKTAQKIILDLKGVIVEAENGNKKPIVEDELIDMLISIGYRKEDYTLIADQLPEGSVEMRMKAALKLLGKRN